jgi:RNA polymerase sigma factor (sigma-70 family)
MTDKITFESLKTAFLDRENERQKLFIVDIAQYKDTYRSKKRKSVRVRMQGILDKIDENARRLSAGLMPLGYYEIAHIGHSVLHELYTSKAHLDVDKATLEVNKAMDARAKELHAREDYIESMAESFRPMIEDLAQPYKKNRSDISYSDMVQEGLQALMLVLRTKSNYRAGMLEREITRAVKGRYAELLTGELKFRHFHTFEEDISAFNDSSVVDIADKLDDMEGKRKKAINNILETLTVREQKAIELRYGLNDGTERTLDEIGDEFSVTRERARQILAKGIRRIKFTYERYSKLKEFVNVYQAENEPTLYVAPEKSMEELLKEIETEVETVTGKSMDEFRIYYNLSRDNFASMLSDAYPELTPFSKLALVKLCANEMQYMPDNSKYLQKPTSTEELKQTLARLGRKDQLTSREKRNLESTLSNMYFPLFLSDQQRCLDTLRTEASDISNSRQVRELFKKISEQFSKVASLNVEGVKTRLDLYQKVDVSILKDKDSFIIASEMGTGKTLEAITYSLARGARKVLVISTQSAVYSTWPSELRKHLSVAPSISIINGSIPHTQNTESQQWHLATYGTVRRHLDALQRMNFDLIVLDECHRINNRDTIQSSNVRALDSKYKLAISGSLFKNRRSELFAVLNWLFPETFYDSDRFMRQYAVTDEGMYQLQYELRNRMICRFKEQVISLPNVEHVHETALFDDKQQKEYNAMEDDFAKWYLSHNSGGNPFGTIVFAKLHALQRKAIEPKYQIIDEIISHIVDNEKEKVVIFTTYLNVVDQLIERYGSKYGFCKITGATQGQERVAQLEAIRNDPDKRLFIITSAGQESLDLSSVSRIIYVNKPLTYADEKQVLDRLHRRGQAKQVVASHIITTDSIDERIAKLTERKREEYKRTVHDAFYYDPKIHDDVEHNVRELVEELVSSRYKR